MWTGGRKARAEAGGPRPTLPPGSSTSGEEGPEAQRGLLFAWGHRRSTETALHEDQGTESGPALLGCLPQLWNFLPQPCLPRLGPSSLIHPRFA